MLISKRNDFTGRRGVVSRHKVWTDKKAIQELINSFSSEVKVLRPWQQKAYKVYSEMDCRHFRIRASTGSGKTLLAKALILKYLEDNPNCIAIVSVPLLAVSFGFTKKESFKLDKNTININSLIPRKEHNFAAAEEYVGCDSKMKDFERAIKSRTGVAAKNRTFIISHAILSKLDPKKLENCLLIVDEVHHSLAVDNNICNGIGKRISYCCEKAEEKNIAMIHLTATPIRADGGSLVPEKYDKDFKCFDLYTNDHLYENCAGMSFTYDYFFHEGDYLGENGAISKFYSYEKLPPTIIIFPHTSSTKYAPFIKDKEMWVRKSIEAIVGRKISTKKIYTKKDGKDNNPDVHVDEDGVMNIHNGKRNIRIVDLLNGEGENQKRRKKLTSWVSDRKNGDTVDVVLGMMIPREGFDWERASRLILIGYQSSLVQVLQIIGRLFRFHEEKLANGNIVQMCQLFPFVDPKKLKVNEMDSKVGDFMNTILMSMVIEAIFSPPNIIYKMKGKENKKIQKNNVMTIFINKIGESKAISIINKCFLEVLIVKNMFAHKTETEKTSILKKRLFQILGDHNVPTDLKELMVDCVVQIDKNRSFNSKKIISPKPGMDVSDLEDIDTLNKVISGEWVEHYSNTTDIKLLDRIQIRLTKSRNMFKYREMKKWFDAHGKRRPNSKSSDPEEAKHGKFYDYILKKEKQSQRRGEEFILR